MRTTARCDRSARWKFRRPSRRIASEARTDENQQAENRHRGCLGVLGSASSGGDHPCAIRAPVRSEYGHVCHQTLRLDAAELQDPRRRRIERRTDRQTGRVTVVVPIRRLRESAQIQSLSGAA
jgi:hypothetical protein